MIIVIGRFALRDPMKPGVCLNKILVPRARPAHRRMRRHPCRITPAQSVIRRFAVNCVDGHVVEGRGRGFKLQAELLLDGCEDARRRIGSDSDIRGWAARLEVNLEIVMTRKSSFIDDGPPYRRTLKQSREFRHLDILTCPKYLARDGSADHALKAGRHNREALRVAGSATTRGSRWVIMAHGVPEFWPALPHTQRIDGERPRLDMKTQMEAVAQQIPVLLWHRRGCWRRYRSVLR
jgi:hypothetical protein